MLLMYRVFRIKFWGYRRIISVPCSTVVSIYASNHAEDPGSIPGKGVYFLSFVSSDRWIGLFRKILRRSTTSQKIVLRTSAFSSCRSHRNMKLLSLFFFIATASAQIKDACNFNVKNADLQDSDPSKFIAGTKQLLSIECNGSPNSVYWGTQVSQFPSINFVLWNENDKWRWARGQEGSKIWTGMGITLLFFQLDSNVFTL